jgi:hypothetical protein
VVVYRSTREFGEGFDPGRVIALVRDANQRVAGADEVQGLRGAREQGNDALTVAQAIAPSILLLAQIS